MTDAIELKNGTQHGLPPTRDSNGTERSVYLHFGEDSVCVDGTLTASELRHIADLLERHISTLRRSS